MPELILGIVVALMGLAWWFQPSSNGPARETPSVVRENTGRSQMILVNSVEESFPFACRPLEKEEDEPVIRNLTQSFEQRSYLVEPSEQCILE